MAEKEVTPDGSVSANRPTGPEVELRNTADDLVRTAPEPSDKAKKSYRCLYPTDRFVMEGMPVVTASGTPLTDEQFKKLSPVAEASGVRIVEVEV